MATFLPVGTVVTVITRAGNTVLGYSLKKAVEVDLAWDSRMGYSGLAVSHSAFCNIHTTPEGLRVIYRIQDALQAHLADYAPQQLTIKPL